jgi:hypothetical protein
MAVQDGADVREVTKDGLYPIFIHLQFLFQDNQLHKN